MTSTLNNSVEALHGLAAEVRRHGEPQLGDQIDRVVDDLEAALARREADRTTDRSSDRWIDGCERILNDQAPDPAWCPSSLLQVWEQQRSKGQKDNKPDRFRDTPGSGPRLAG